jgi:EAL domain-containing protein (putative c-di-GMP-specific phosphodiesterase class I)
MAVADSGDIAPEDLLRDADAAMYAAKARGGMSHALFDEEMRVDAATHRRLEHDLNRALDAGQLTVVYQPLVRLFDGLVVGAEALLRWQHPERGMIPPDVFVPLAERTGLIVPIGNWVLSEACRQAAAWCGNEPFTIAVNVSPRQLTDRQLPDVVARVLATTGLPPDRLRLEITESVLIDGASTVGAALAQLKALGLGLALDDFGTGYASLSYLQRFPIDVLKLDRSFVRDLPSRGTSDAIVTSTVALVQALGLTLVAEGVQTQAQAEYLAAIGCQHAQGYHFGRPTAPAAISALLAERRPRQSNPPATPDSTPAPRS